MRYFAVLAMLLFTVLGEAQETDAKEDSKFTFSGYDKTFFLFYDMQKNTAPESAYSTMQNTLRGRAFYKPKEWFSFEGAYQLSPSGANADISKAAFSASPSVNKYRLTDAPETIYHSDDQRLKLLHSIDRLNIAFSLPFADIFIGRQAISFGSGLVVSPSDVFSPFSYQDLNKEEKVGVDAVRVKFPMGKMGEFDTGFVFGENGKFSKSAAFVSSKFYIWETNITLTVMDFMENLLASVNIERSIGGAGVWLEGAYTEEDILSGRKSAGRYGRLTAGANYNFPNNIFVFGEYHYNSAGAVKANLENYASNIKKTAYTEGGAYLQGQHYLAPGMSYQITPLLTGSFQMLINLTDPSFFMSPKLEYNVADNAYFDVGAFIGIGRTPGSIQIPFSDQTIPVPRSEFGMYPYMIYTSMRMYF